MLQINQPHNFFFLIIFWNVSSLSPQVDWFLNHKNLISADQTNWKSHFEKKNKKIKQCFFQWLATSLKWSTSVQPAQCANVLHILLSTPEVCKPQSLVSSNMSQLDSCGSSLLRAHFLKVVQLASRTPTLHKTKDHGFSHLSQLMKTISFQPTVIKSRGKSAAKLLKSALPKCFLFYYYNYNLPGVEEMIGGSS